MADDILLTVQEEPDITLEYVEAAIKPETVGHVTPKRQAQTVYPASGTVFGSVEVDPIPDPILQNTSITPTKQKQTVTADSGFDGLGTVEVEPIPPEYIIPQGKTKITQNVTGFDVSQYAEVDVDVGIEHGVILSDIGTDGAPRTITTYGYVIIPDWFFYGVGAKSYNRSYIYNKIETINLNEGIIDIRGYAFRETKYVTEIEMPSTLQKIDGTYTFTNSGIMLIDFSKCSSVVTLTSILGIGIKSDCVIRVPQSLLAEWQAAPNWSALTNVIWEGV